MTPRARVKFHLAGGSQPLILLPVNVNDHGPYKFILDTGASTSLLSSELAKQLEVKIIGAKEGQSAGGKVSISLAKIHPLPWAKPSLTMSTLALSILTILAKRLAQR